MGPASAIVAALTGTLLLVIAVVLVMLFPPRAARRWAFSWSLIALGCAEVALAPALEWQLWPTSEAVVRTALVAGSMLALLFGFFLWSEPRRRVGAKTVLWLGLLASLVPPALGWTRDNPWAWAWTVGWAWVPLVATIVLVARGAGSPSPLVRSQARGFLWALLVGPFPFLLSWSVTPSWGFSWWGLGLPPFALLGAALMTRTLVYHDSRFHPEKATSFLVENVQDAVLFLQSEGRVQDLNPALKALLDQDQGLRGQPLSLLGADEVSHRCLGPLEALALADWEGTVQLTHRTGRPVPVHLVYRRIHNPARKAVGAVVLLHDLRHSRRVDLSHREDPVTNLANRRWTLELFETEFQRVRRYGGPLTALWLTLGGLEALEQRSGAEACDEVLRRLGGILRGGLRRTDFCGRVEQREVLVVLPETTAEKGQLVGYRLAKMFALAFEGESGVFLEVVVGNLADEASSSEFLAHLKSAVPQKGEPV